MGGGRPFPGSQGMPNLAWGGIRNLNINRVFNRTKFACACLLGKIFHPPLINLTPLPQKGLLFKNLPFLSEQIEQTYS